MPLSPEVAKATAAKARAAKALWRDTPLEIRIDLVMKAVAYIGLTTDRMVTELANQMGRPVRYGGEFGGFEERAHYMASIAADALAPIEIEDSDAFVRFIEREPQGVVFVVAPWNYPYMTAINTIAPALIAGNTVVLKHASQTIHIGEHAFGEACRFKRVRQVFSDKDG
ncbi:MAG: aldehyde dehydrogenase family protein, partial [Pseudomonadota bacterium]